MINSITLLARFLTDKAEEKELKLIKLTVKDLAGMALKNKVLPFFTLKLKKLGLDNLLPKHIKERAERLERKFKIYFDLIDKLSKIAYNQGFNYAIVKSIKPYPYVGDDIDVLVDAKDYRNFIKSIVKKLDFKIEGHGPAETTLYKHFEGFKLMIDVHHKLAASTLSYVDTYNVLKTKQKKLVCFNGDSIETYVPSPEYAILISSAHAILKELRINLADILDVWFMSNQANLQILYKIAKNEGLMETLKTIRNYVNTTLSPQKTINLPCRISTLKLIKCYVEKTANTLSKGKYSEIIKAPLTNIKGYGILLKYLKGHG